MAIELSGNRRRKGFHSQFKHTKIVALRVNCSKVPHKEVDNIEVWRSTLVIAIAVRVGFVGDVNPNVRLVIVVDIDRDFNNGNSSRTDGAI